METQFTEYAANHYKHGVCAVFGQSRNDSISLVACIEDHQFQPKNYWYDLLVLFFSVYFCWLAFLTCLTGMVVGDLSGVRLSLVVLESFKELSECRFFSLQSIALQSLIVIIIV